MADELLARIVAAGIPEDEVRGLLRRTVYELAFEFVYMVDEPDGTLHSEPPYADVGDDKPRWMLMEVDPDGNPTGRDVGGLHESLLDADPSGTGGGDWL